MTLPQMGVESGAMPEGLGGMPEGGAMPGGAGGTFGGASLESVLDHTESHGGGTVAVASQLEAAASIIESGAEVAGIGGFSDKETSVSAAWLEEQIESGKIRWILSGDGMVGGPGGMAGAGTAAGPTGMAGGPGGDNRNGSTEAIETVTRLDLHRSHVEHARIQRRHPLPLRRLTPLATLWPL